MAKIYLNNKFVDEAEAKISVKDRGLRYGDGCFETISFFNQKPYLLEGHLQRLAGGLQAIKINFDANALPELITQTIANNNIKNGFVRIMVTRGEGSRGYMPTYKTPPTLVIEVMERPNMQTTEAKICISSYKKMAGVPTEFKLMQGLNSVLAKIEAHEKGFFETIMLNENGFITEVSAGNLFFVKNEKVFTPSLQSGCLAGVMRGNIIKLLQDNVTQGLYKPTDLESADEIFITNVTWQILPVVEIEGLNFKPKNFDTVDKIRKLIDDDIFNLEKKI
jgi:aminodeoxychorismate lyase